MRRFLHFTSSMLASTSLALGIIAASVAIGRWRRETPIVVGRPMLESQAA